MKEEHLTVAFLVKLIHMQFTTLNAVLEIHFSFGSEFYNYLHFCAFPPTNICFYTLTESIAAVSLQACMENFPSHQLERSSLSGSSFCREILSSLCYQNLHSSCHLFICMSVHSCIRDLFFSFLQNKIIEL